VVRVYRYIYYRIYAWNLRLWGKEDLPQYNACLGLALVSIANLFTLLIALDMLGIKLTGSLKQSLKPTILALLSASFLAHHQYFVRSRRYLRLEAEFQARPLLSPGPGLALVLLYVGGSLVLLFCLAFAGAVRRSAA
jgi:hypothetical protein